MDESERGTFFKDNYLPSDIDLEFEHFMTFYQQRQKKLRFELKKVLALTSGRQEDAMVWDDRDDEMDEQIHRTSEGFSQ